MDILQQRNRKQVGGVAAPAGAPAAGGAAPAAAPGAALAPAAPQQRGSGFVSFDRLLAANQAGAQAMAQKVGDRVQQAGTAATAAIQGGKDAFATKSQQAALVYDPSRATTSAQAAALGATTYTGPKTWKDAGVDTDAISRQVNQGQAAVAQLQSQGGLANLLRESYNTNSTAGGSALDAALTGAAGGGRFQQLQQQFSGLDKLLSDARGSEQGVYDANANATKDAAAKYAAMAPHLADVEATRDRAQHLSDAEARNRLRTDANAQERADSPGQWGQNEADALDDIKSTPRTNRRRVGGN